MGSDVLDHHQEVVTTLRRSSSGHILDSSADSSQVILGTLHCTIRYSFDKNALVVTVNRCENLPAKDSTAKSRLEPFSITTDMKSAQIGKQYIKALWMIFFA